MVIFPNAKINLGLRITEKRKDGFHNLQTCFYPIPYFDVLEVIPSKKDSLKVYNFESADNIVVKARDLLRNTIDFPPVDIFLYKNIPAGAGLGGGSADAAFLLIALNELFKLKVTDEELLAIAGKVGKDCPFFIKNKPVFATNTGDRFEPIALKLEGYFLLVITPDVPISTVDAFSWIKPQMPAISLIESLQNSEPASWNEMIGNDFQPVIEERFPEVRQALENLKNSGAIYTSLTGTGSSVYGIFADKPRVETIPSHWKFWSAKL